MKTTINVTQYEISSGIRNRCKHCPIALAFNRVLDEYYCAYVLKDEVLFRSFLHGYSLRLPESASVFIEKFDNGNPVKPFSFEIDIPESMLLENNYGK